MPHGLLCLTTTPGPIVSDKMNRFVVQTEETLYHYRCPKRTPVVGKLDPGVFVIDVEPRCVLDSTRWMLHGLPMVTSNFSQEQTPPLPLPLSWFQFPNSTNFHLKVHQYGKIGKLTFENFDDLQAPADTNIEQQIAKIQEQIGHSKLPWWLWLIISVAGAIALASVVYFVLLPRWKLYLKRNERTVTYDTTEEKVDLKLRKPNEIYPELNTKGTDPMDTV